MYYKSFEGDQRVGSLYRRVSDEYMDPTCFLPESVIGIPNLMSAYRAGNVAIINAPGNGAADDKGIYYFVPRMVKYYLDEEPLLQNAPTSPNGIKVPLTLLAVIMTTARVAGRSSFSIS